jgi:hypothetical protein
MKIEQEWLKKQYEAEGEDKPDEYVLAILKVGEKVLDLMELVPENEPIDANKLILQADKELEEGITGNMAGMVALIATKCHSRGQEFKKSWNTYYGKPDATGVINPAIITIG